MASEESAVAQTEYERLKKLSESGIYVPPARLRALMSEMSVAKGSAEMQRMNWEQLKKQINGSVNRANTANIATIIKELLRVNLNRGMGLLVRQLMKAQSQALSFTPVYAALVAALNPNIPQIGELLIARLVLQFRKAYKRNNRVICLSSTAFLAHLCNQQVCHEIVILEILHLLLMTPTDDSVDICCGILKHCGLFLQEVSSSALSELFEKLRVLLQEGKLQKRTQYMIEILFQIRRDGYKDHPIIPKGLSLVNEEDQVTHKVRLDDKLKAQDDLNVFCVDPKYDENEEAYTTLRQKILGNEIEDLSDADEPKEYDSGSDHENLEGGTQLLTQVHQKQQEAQQPQMKIQDMTESNLTNFRKTIYLILKGSMSADEVVHKITKMAVKQDEQPRVVEILVQACSQERTYSKYYGTTGEKLIGQSASWGKSFAIVFSEGYETIHRLEPNQLRNVSKFWGHLLASDALGWEALECIKLTEADTSSAGRIFIKFVFQELVEELGIPHLKERFDEDYIKPYVSGIFPQDDSQHLQFSINYFTAIGLGILTDGMRDSLDELKRKRLEERERGRDGRSRSKSRSYSRTPSHSRSRSRSRSLSYSRSRSPYSRTPSRSPRRPYSRTPSPYSRTPSRSPARHNRSRSPKRPYARSPGRERNPVDTPKEDQSLDYRDSLRYRGAALKDQNEEFKKSGFAGGREYGRGGYKGRR